MPDYLLIKDGVVKNVAVFEAAPDLPGYDHIIDRGGLDPVPGIGWAYDGEAFTPPTHVVELGVLSHDKWAVTADGSDKITVTYTAAEAVVFVVNDEVHIVTPVDNTATLEITADAPGPIRIDVRGQSLILAAV